MSSTRTKRSERGLDFYETPAWCVEAIAPHLPRVCALDPACGDGAILSALIASGWDGGMLDGIEFDGARAAAAFAQGFAVEAGDALTMDWNEPALVVMNPPFSQAEAFVRKALAETEPARGTVAALLRLAFLEGKSRAELHRERPSDVYVLSRRPSFTGGSTDSCAYAWFAWGPGRGGRWSVI